MTNSAIKNYQEQCLVDYKMSIGYPTNYTYYTGNPVNPLVPVQTALNGIMIIGAYPTANFSSIDGIPYTPIKDISSPFSKDTLSGKKLDEVILSKIGVARTECWITNLVKVFLFKEGHIDKYRIIRRKQGIDELTMAENRKLFNEYASKSLKWIEMEMEIANPYLIITLGEEVTASLLKVSKAMAKSKMDGNIHQAKMGDMAIKIMSLPHPGILMKKTMKNQWIELFENEIAPNAKKEIQILKELNIINNIQDGFNN